MAQFSQHICHIIGTTAPLPYLWQLILMMLLLCCSAFFSGSETAFFNLSRRQVTLLKESSHRLQVLAARLLNEPKRLLGTLLFGNMVVNVLFFAVASVFTFRIEQRLSITAAAIAAVGTFSILILFGEIFPKSLAFANSWPVSITTALPVFICTQIFAPLQYLFRLLLVEPSLRLLLGSAKPAKPIDAGEFRALIDRVRKHGLITTDQNRFLTEVIEMGLLRVRHCLRPRVDMIACEVTEPPQVACEIMQKNHLVKLPVYAKTIDNIVGVVYLRQILLRPDTSLDETVQPVHFVPEQKTIESLLEFFRSTGTDTAIVVDEYGGIAGSICLEDIAEEVLGPIAVAEHAPSVQQVGPFEYRMAGNLSIHDWADSFGLTPTEIRVSTMAGLVTALLGKMPKAGDVAHIKNLKFTVERVQKHRIESLILTLEPIAGND